MASRGKRSRLARVDAVDLSAVAPSQPKRQRKAAPIAGQLVDGGLSQQEQQQAEADRQVADRAFFDAYSTVYLWAWARDYPELKPHAPPELMLDRDAVLTLLVSRGAGRPSAANVQMEFMRTWQKQCKPAAGASPPPLLHMPAVLPGQAALAATPVLARGGAPHQQHATHNSSDEEDEEELQFEVQMQQLLQPAHAPTPPLPPVRPAAAAAAHAAPYRETSPLAAEPQLLFTKQKCRSCLHSQVSESQFICGGCGLRGDLDADAPANQFLASKMAGRASSASAASSSQGQTATNIPASDPAISRLDKWFIARTATGVAQPAFTGPAAATPLTHGVACAMSREAFDAMATMPPSDALINYIRAGKLTEAGYAIPKLISSQRDATSDDAIGSVHFMSDGTSVQQAKNATVAPAVSSPQQFCMALFSTILPALIDRPTALMEWVALGRTALSLTAQFDWSLAEQYVSQLLTARIPLGATYKETHMSVLSSLTVQFARRSHQQQGAARPPTSSTQLQRSSRGGQSQQPRPRSNDPCQSWNNGTCNFGAACKFTHKCRSCGDSQHSGPNCPKGDTRPPPRADRFPRSGASVVTAAQAPLAAGPAAAANTKH